MTRKGNLNNVVENIPKKKNKKKMKFKVDFVRVLLIVVAVYFSVTFIRQQKSINEYNVKLASVKEDIKDSKAKIEELKEMKTRANDADYIEEYAREECGLVKPYEMIFIDVNK